MSMTPGTEYLGIIAAVDALGLLVNQPAGNQTTGGTHTTGSLHYDGRAVDFGQALQGGHDNIAAIFRALEPYAQGPGHVISELFHDPLGGWKNGVSIGAIGGHGNHTHVGVKVGIDLLEATGFPPISAAGPGGYNPDAFYSGAPVTSLNPDRAITTWWDPAWYDFQYATEDDFIAQDTNSSLVSPSGPSSFSNNVIPHDAYVWRPTSHSGITVAAKYNLDTAFERWFLIDMAVDLRFASPSACSHHGITFDVPAGVTMTVWADILTQDRIGQGYDANKALVNAPYASGTGIWTMPTFIGSRHYVIRLTGTGTGTVRARLPFAGTNDQILTWTDLPQKVPTGYLPGVELVQTAFKRGLIRTGGYAEEGDLLPYKEVSATGADAPPNIGYSWIVSLNSDSWREIQTGFTVDGVAANNEIDRQVSEVKNRSAGTIRPPVPDGIDLGAVSLAYVTYSDAPRSTGNAFVVFVGNTSVFHENSGLTEADTVLIGGGVPFVTGGTGDAHALTLAQNPVSQYDVGFRREWAMHRGNLGGFTRMVAGPWRLAEHRQANYDMSVNAHIAHEIRLGDVLWNYNYLVAGDLPPGPPATGVCSPRFRVFNITDDGPWRWSSYQGRIDRAPR